MKVLGLGIAILLVCGAALFVMARSGVKSPPPDPLPTVATFVGSESCRKCHEERHETWLGTAHAYALSAPGEGSVEGDFNGETIETPWFAATPYRNGDEYRMRVQGRDGRASGDYAVDRVVGRSFEQAYLLKDAKGEWRVLPLCWSIERKEWDKTHEILASITGHVGVIPDNYDSRDHIFNHGCGQCHATRYDVGHDLAAGTYQSTFLEGAVSCESCHGPGSVHAAWYERPESAERAEPAAASLVHPRKDFDARQVQDTCGRCHYMHEWRYAIDDDARMGHAEIAISLNHDRPGFLADGRLSGLNYHGSTQSQSACFLKGEMSCLSCHRMHGGKKWAMKWEENDDAQCMQCHGEPAWASREHTHHAPESARCVDCHMPKFMSGVLHFMRDHSIRSPDPALTEKFGAAQSPNACNACHTDQTASWAREWRDQWWGPGPERMREDVGLVVALREDATAVATARLAAVALAPESLLFFRTTAARALAARPRDPAAREAILRLLGDADAEIVQTVVVSLALDPHPAYASALLPLLEHAVRTVRVEAGLALGLAGYRGSTPALERVYADALGMFTRQKRFAETVEQPAMIARMLGRDEEADSHFDDLIRINAYPSGSWPASGLRLLLARARRLTEQARHADALQLYGRVRDLGPEPVPSLLYLDSADSLLGVGLAEQAARNWLLLVQQWPAEDPASRLAQAHLRAAAGEIDAARTLLAGLVAELSKDPAGGEMLQRVRYAEGVIGR